MNRLAITDLPLAGLKRVERQRLSDARGFLSRLFCAEELGDAGWNKPVAQINHSYTAARGTVRGLHFQYPPHADMKLVSCLHGEVWDVAVDIRVGSKTFLCWHAERLSADAGSAILIPRGFAHGFQSFSDSAELLYCHSVVYNAAAEGTINPLDPRLAIAWPLPIANMSSRDFGQAMLSAAFAGVAP